MIKLIGAMVVACVVCFGLMLIFPRIAMLPAWGDVLMYVCVVWGIMKVGGK